MLDTPGGLIEDIAIDHENVAGDECDSGPLRIFDDHGRRTELPLLP